VLDDSDDEPAHPITKPTSNNAQPNKEKMVDEKNEKKDEDKIEVRGNSKVNTPAPDQSKNII